MHHPVYTRSHINYCSVLWCLLTTSTGSSAELLILRNVSNDYKHLLATRYEIEVLHTECTNLNIIKTLSLMCVPQKNQFSHRMHNFEYHLSLFPDVYIYKIVKSLDQRAPLFQHY